MIVPTPHRYDLTALDPPATPSGVDAQIPLAAELVQVVEFGAKVRTSAFGASATEPHRSSFWMSGAVDKAVSVGATDDNSFALGPGLWSLHLAITLVGVGAGVGTATDALTRASLDVVDPDANAIPVVPLQVGSNPQVVSHHLRMLLVRTPWQFRIHLPATTATQTVSLRLCVLGTKLL